MPTLPANPAIEQTIIDNLYGTVTNKRVTYFAKKSWFSGGYREDVPLKQVVSVRYETSRMIFAGFFLVVIGLFLVLAIIGIIPLAIGILLVWGTPTVNVVTAGGTATPVKGCPWQKEEVEAFVSALRNQLFSE